MTSTSDDFKTDRFDVTVQRFATQGVVHQHKAGVESKASTDPGWDAWRAEWMDARSNLAAVMILRHVRRVAPEMLPELIDLADTASLLTEFGVALKLDQYLTEAGGSPEFVARAIRSGQ